MLVQNIRPTSFFRLSPIKLLVLALIFSFQLHAGWSEQQLKKLTLKQKIAQLFMIPAWTFGPNENCTQVEQLLQEYPIGGVLWMQGTIESQQKAITRLQEASSIPLFFGQDNEWGLDLRLKGALRFPRNMTLGAIQNEKLIYKFGREIANQCKGVGVHINFAPVVDVNSNSNNPVINDRSFGENPQKVAQRSLLYMKGLQDGGVMACAKHFPGHGDTLYDSHVALPVINKSISELEKTEWIPFNALITQGLQSVMIGHLLLPDISDHPTSLSSATINHYLKNELGFKGLVFTDALNMKAVTDGYPAGKIELIALQAGNDVLVFPQDVKASIEAIYQAVLSHEISEETINTHVLKVLKAKEQFKLHQNKALPKIDLFSIEAKKLKKQLYYEAITLVKCDQNTLPLNPSNRYAFIQIGRDFTMKDSLEITHAPYNEQKPDSLPPFFNTLNEKLNVDYFFVPKECDAQYLKNFLCQLESYQNIIVGIYEMNKFPKKNFGITNSTLSLLHSLSNKTIYLSLFGSPYSLKYFSNENVILIGYENDEDAQVGCGKILLGEQKPLGKLPITASSNYPLNHGLFLN